MQNCLLTLQLHSNIALVIISGIDTHGVITCQTVCWLSSYPAIVSLLNRIAPTLKSPHKTKWSALILLQDMINSADISMERFEFADDVL